MLKRAGTRGGADSGAL
jgi:hypothetical protein